MSMKENGRNSGHEQTEYFGGDFFCSAKGIKFCKMKCFYSTAFCFIVLPLQLFFPAAHAHLRESSYYFVSKAHELNQESN